MHWDGSKAPLSSHHCPVPSRSPQRRPAPRVRTPTHPSRGRLVSLGNAVILVFYKWTQHRSILTSHFLCVSWGSILVCTDLVTSLTTVFCRISTVRFISLFSRQWMFWFIHHFLNRNCFREWPCAVSEKACIRGLTGASILQNRGFSVSLEVFQKLLVSTSLATLDFVWWNCVNLTSEGYAPVLMSSSVTAGVWAFLCVCARLDHGVPSLASQQSACILGLAFCSAV